MTLAVKFGSRFLNINMGCNYSFATLTMCIIIHREDVFALEREGPNLVTEAGRNYFIIHGVEKKIKWP